MVIDRILPFTKHLLNRCVEAGETVIDATCGNGNDTLFLSELVGDRGLVLAFDIQERAIEVTREKLESAKISNVKLILDGHENVKNYTDSEISAAIFNLGYLPGSDKSITTNGETTWRAVTNILKNLKKSGIIILVIYHGHDSGKIERDAIEANIATLDKGATAVLRYEFLNKESAPYIIAIERVI